MSKKKSRDRKPRPAPPAVVRDAPLVSVQSASVWPAILGAVFLGVSAAASLLLVVEHLGGMSLPGCGPGGACEQAARSKWGAIRLGSFEWPTAYVGLAYFLAMLVAWLATRATVTRAFRYLVRLGALVSLGFCAIIVREHMLCQYCLAAHAGNFAFWITMEATRRGPARAGPAWASLIAVFAIVSGGLGVLDWQHREQARQKAERELAESTADIIARSREGDAPREGEAPAEPPLEGESRRAGTAESRPATVPAPTTAPVPAAQAQPFEGRYRHGPEAAPIRIVMFTDYQCPDCYGIETQQLSKLMAERSDLAVSIKHFPFCRECNPFVDRDLHPNACWAARAAEAAGMLWGPEGFWKMHEWLFAHHGRFETTAVLEAGIRELGYDPTGFVQTMSSPETLRRVKEDVNEAKSLGLYFTPMIFINGVELKGWQVPQALLRTVTQVAASNPPARTAAADRPPRALEKYVADWKDQPVQKMPADTRTWVLGAAQPQIRIVLWGDYQEPYTQEADRAIRAFVGRRSDAAYTFRHYPFNSDCNPNVKEQRHPQACRASQAAEAAGQLAGNDAYWKMHAWLMEHPKQFSDQTLRAAATEMGLDADALIAAMGAPEVQAAIAEDVQAGKQFPSLRWGMPAGIHSIPSVFINDRYVPRVRLEDRLVLDDILNAAAAP